MRAVRNLAVSLRLVPGGRGAHALRRMVSGGSHGYGGRVRARAMAGSSLAPARGEVPSWASRWLRFCGWPTTGGVWERAGFCQRSLLGEGDRAARGRAESGAPQCPGGGHLFFEIGAVEYGGRELGPFLAGGGHVWPWESERETAEAIGGAVVAVGSAGVLRAVDRLWLGAASCLHVVAVCHFQPALWTPVAAHVCGFGRSVDGFCLSSPRSPRAQWKTGGGAVGADPRQRCIGVEGGTSVPAGSAEELGDSESLEFRRRANGRCDSRATPGSSWISANMWASWSRRAFHCARW
jgi:hypothetical protein